MKSFSKNEYQKAISKKAKEIKIAINDGDVESFHRLQLIRRNLLTFFREMNGTRKIYHYGLY